MPSARALLVACVALASAGALRAQAVAPLRDPWRGERWVEYLPGRIPVGETGPARLAVDSADMVGKGFPYRLARVRVARRPFVLLEGWSGEGTGWAQLTYWAFEVLPDSTIALRWRAVAAEHWDPGGPSGLGREYPAYELRSCLLLDGAGALAYAASGLPPFDRGSDPPAPRAGCYAWSERARTFVFAAPPDGALRAACRRVRHGVRYDP